MDKPFAGQDHPRTAVSKVSVLVSGRSLALTAVNSKQRVAVLLSCIIHPFSVFPSSREGETSLKRRTLVYGCLLDRLDNSKMNFHKKNPKGQLGLFID